MEETEIATPMVATNYRCHPVKSNHETDMNCIGRFTTPPMVNQGFQNGRGFLWRMDKDGGGDRTSESSKLGKEDSCEG